MPPDPTALVRLATLFYGVLFGLAWLGSAVADHPLFFRSAGARAAGVDWLPEILLGAAVAALVIGVSAWLERVSERAREMSRALTALLGPLRTGHCLVLAALSGLAEEALFRGVLQPLVGWIPASVLFGLAHFAPRRDLWPWTFFALAAGLLLGGLYEWTGTLVAPIVAHAGINAVNLRRLGGRYGTDG